MRFFTAIIEGKELPGFAIGEKAGLFCEAFPGTAPESLADFLRSDWEPLVKQCAEKPMPHRWADWTLAAPIPNPVHDILCVGKNYTEHIEELGNRMGTATVPEAHYFSKRAHKVYGHGETVPMPFAEDTALDYEVELAVVIGKEGRDIAPEKVWDHIFGFSVFNDFSARTLQSKHVQWFRGKSLDGLTAMGPWIVTKDEFTHPLHLALSCTVNGEIRQSSNTQRMIFNVEALVSELSRGMTLVPGDIVATGTPAGVALGMERPVFLKPGDTVTARVEGIGELRNDLR